MYTALCTICTAALKRAKPSIVGFAKYIAFLFLHHMSSHIANFSYCYLLKAKATDPTCRAGGSFTLKHKRMHARAVARGAIPCNRKNVFIKGLRE